MLTLPLTQVTVVFFFDTRSSHSTILTENTFMPLILLTKHKDLLSHPVSTSFKTIQKLRQNSHVIQKNITVTPNWRQATAGAIAIENMSESIGVGYRIIYQSRA